MTWQKTAAALAALTLALLLAMPAGATPDRVASVGDLPLGHTDSHLYLLRTFSDNMGSHYSATEHIFLVKQDMQTGEIADQWLVRTMRHDQRFDWPEGSSTPPSRIVTEVDSYAEGESPLSANLLPVKPANPFEIMRREKAIPLSALSIHPARSGESGWMVDATDGLSKITRSPSVQNKKEVVHKPDKLRTLVSASICPTLREIRKTVSTTSPDSGPYGSEALTMSLQYCAVELQLFVGMEIRDKFHRHNLVALHCEADAEINRWQVWIYVGDDI